jgi:hypothetical protein
LPPRFIFVALVGAGFETGAPLSPAAAAGAAEAAQRLCAEISQSE